MFDVVTIAGLWPQWAVLARAVAGVTERPFHLGDPIYTARAENANVKALVEQILWREQKGRNLP